MIIPDNRDLAQWDRFTIENTPISSYELMERASRAFTNKFIELFPDRSPNIGVVCGSGNNGGDGLAIARMLRDAMYTVTVIDCTIGSRSPDNDQNFQRLSTKRDIALIHLESRPDDQLLSGFDILIDAIFGYGLSRPVEGKLGETIRLMNASAATRVAVDMPSGLMCDQLSEEPIFQADHTLTFQVPKLSLLLPQNQLYAGTVNILDIQLSDDFNGFKSQNHYITEDDIAPVFRARHPFAHKGHYGHAALYCGQKGMIGAAILAARACLRSGIGKLTCGIPEAGYGPLQTAVPEAMAHVLKGRDFITGFDTPHIYNSIGIGCGLGLNEATRKPFYTFLSEIQCPVVIDADGLNLLALNKDAMEHIPPKAVLTPHAGEFKRLFGGWDNDYEKIELQRKSAAANDCIIVLKGAYTSVAVPDGTVYFNSTGNPGMATAGSGDVLTGMITALLGQGLNPVEAACAAVYAHGMAGDIAARKKGQHSMIASDIIDNLPEAFTKIQTHSQQQ